MSILVSREQFLDRYDKPNTKAQIVQMFKLWDKFLLHMHTSEADLFYDLRKPENEFQRYQILEHIVLRWKKHRAASSVRCYFPFVRLWIKYNGISLDSDKVKEIRLPKQIKSRVKGIDRDIIVRLLDHMKPFYKTLFIVLACTGMRIRSEALNMRVSWINFETKPVSVLIPGQFTKTSQERLTFLTPEATRMVKEIIKTKKQNDLVFPVSYMSVYFQIQKARTRAGLGDKSSNGYHYNVQIRKLRGFTENKLSRAVGMEYAHAVIGHDKYLRQYHDSGTTDEEFGKDYLEAVPALTINSDVKLTEENLKLKDQVEDIGSLKEEVARLRAMVERQSRIRQATLDRASLDV